jgi:hypothetical protein
VVLPAHGVGLPPNVSLPPPGDRMAPRLVADYLVPVRDNISVKSGLDVE